MLNGILKLFSLLSNNIGVDLGTANTVIYLEGKGVVLSEPSIVAVDVKTGKVIAVGMEAKEMLGKTPETIQTIRPLRDGVITDFEATRIMLSYFINKVIGGGLLKPKRNMVVDIGGGTTDIAVISLAGIVASTSIRVAGDEMTEAVAHYIKKKHHILIGEQTAERIKIELGSAVEEEEERVMEIKGRDITGLPKTITVTNREITQALEDVIGAIINALKTTLERTPPELASDIAERGITLAGGGSLLRNLDVRVHRETGIMTKYCEDPITAVARGVGSILDKIHLIRRVSME
jgi:rod shape-determining protein MreB